MLILLLMFAVILLQLQTRGRPNFVFVLGAENDNFFYFSAFYFSAEKEFNIFGIFYFSGR